jgi:hypothetical protein
MVVDPPPLAPREVRRRRSRLGKADVIAGGGTPACATPGRTPLGSTAACLPPRSTVVVLPQGHRRATEAYRASRNRYRHRA